MRKNATIRKLDKETDSSEDEDEDEEHETSGLEATWAKTDVCKDNKCALEEHYEKEGKHFGRRCSEAGSQGRASGDDIPHHGGGYVHGVFLTGVATETFGH